MNSLNNIKNLGIRLLLYLFIAVIVFIYLFLLRIQYIIENKA